MFRSGKRTCAPWLGSIARLKESTLTGACAGGKTQFKLFVCYTFKDSVMLKHLVSSLPFLIKSSVAFSTCWKMAELELKGTKGVEPNRA
jgi:hypothetical protein